jgi:hypothetical protein
MSGEAEQLVRELGLWFCALPGVYRLLVHACRPCWLQLAPLRACLLALRLLWFRRVLGEAERLVRELGLCSCAFPADFRLLVHACRSCWVLLALLRECLLAAAPLRWVLQPLLLALLRCPVSLRAAAWA